MLMQVSDSHPSNADSPILVTLSGMLMLVRDLHQENAEFPMFVTVFGMLYNSSSALYAIIIVLSALNKTLFSYINDFDSILKEPCQPANGFPSIVITLSGMLMLVRESHMGNAEFPILVTVSGTLYDLSSALYAIIIVLSALNKTLFSYMNDFDSIFKEPFQP